MKTTLLHVYRYNLFLILALLLAGCGPRTTPVPALNFPTAAPSSTPLLIAPSATPAVLPSAVPPSAEPATAVPPTAVPPTAVPPTAQPPAPTAILGATRISFATGATSGLVDGSLQPGETKLFLVGASAGQPLMVSASSFNSDVTFSVVGAHDGRTLVDASQKLSSWQDILTATQDYLIRVYAGASGGNYNLNIITPARINFDPGAISATRTGTTPGGLAVAYILRAGAGQQMDVTLTAPNQSAMLGIYGYQDGQPYLRSAMGLQTFSLQLPATQDYMIQVFPNAGQIASYTLNITVK